MDENKKDPYTFHIEVEKARIEMTDEKSKGEDEVPGGVLRLLAEDGLETVAQLINSKMKLVSDVSYNDCFKGEANSYKMQRPSHVQTHGAYGKD